MFIALGMGPMASNAIPGRTEVPVETVLRTAELRARGQRQPDYQAEAKALSELAAALAQSPATILQ